MQRTIEVVDQFYRDPMAVRERALKNSEWIQPSAGEDSMYDARTTTYTAEEEARERLLKILGRPAVDGETAIRGFFTFIGESANDRLVPHVHDAHWAAVVYLTLPDQCSGGIAFYQLPNADIPDAKTDGYLAQSSPTWEETTSIPMRFNRMILFKASTLFHRATHGFGQTPDSGRLAQIFLFQ
jgi:hypothetical protein